MLQSNYSYFYKTSILDVIWINVYNVEIYLIVMTSFYWKCKCKIEWTERVATFVYTCILKQKYKTIAQRKYSVVRFYYLNNVYHKRNEIITLKYSDVFIVFIHIPNKVSIKNFLVIFFYTFNIIFGRIYVYTYKMHIFLKVLLLI